MNNLCVELGYNSLIKKGEEICGDHIDVVEDADKSTIMVLADGLGSGVKAGILSTLTSKILSTMMANGIEIEECISTIASTLPVCQVRQIAYSTFTIIRITDNEEAEIIQYDNPHVILLREGKSFQYPFTVTEIDGKTIYRSQFRIYEGDVFIAMSDGCIHAGVGTRLNFGWQREDVVRFMESLYDTGFTAKTLTTILLNECDRLYGGLPGDDTTVCTMRIRNREPVNLMIGPPERREDVNKMMALFFAKPGKHIVCGGTTSTLAGNYLGKPVTPVLEFHDPEVPPIATCSGIDLVTEGVITINKVLKYAQNYLEDNKMYAKWGYQKDGASRIARLLFEEATDINFYVGKAVNPAHQNPSLPINFNIKMRLVEELAAALEGMGKRVKLSHF